ncbi:MAG: efflux RND transporter periplasmic adaptor subunit [Hyphomicrobiaceae bacterium]
MISTITACPSPNSRAASRPVASSPCSDENGRATLRGWPLAPVCLALLVSVCSAVDVTASDSAASAMVRGVVRPEARTTVSSELVARIMTMPFKTGQPFKAGDTLVTFDCRRYDADLRAAEAEVKTQAILVETSRQLLLHKAAGTSELALAEAKHAQAVATADSLRIRTSQCLIRAPYDGRVVERTADIFEMPQSNAPLLTIIKEGQLEVDLIIPSSWSVWLRPGYEFDFRIEETGTTHKARLLNLGAVVDPISQTMKVTSVLVDPSPLVRPGMSGAARLSRADAEAN